MRISILLFVTALALSAAAAPKPPNILFVLIDDMGYRDLSCLGGTRIQTPEIDRLAREGMRFTQFYVGSPICSPSRTALTTGQYPNRWRITSYLDNRAANARRGMANWLDPSAPSLARYLHDAGYYTAHVGKWHMGGQRDVGDAPLITAYGFDTSLTNFEGLGPRILPKFEPNPDGTPFRHAPTDLSAKLGGDIRWVDRHRVTESFVDEAIVQMKRAQQLGKPFYVNLWPDDVHSPCQAPPGMRGDGSPAANYCGVLRESDKQFGRAFDFIRADPNLKDNTIILVCSDNGHEVGFGSGGELRGSKGQLYEGGIRSPLIVWFPAEMPKASIGAANDSTVITGMDVPPSLLALAGATTPQNVTFDGEDLHNALAGQSAAARRHPIMWVRPPDRPGPKGQLPDLAMRDGQWKLLVSRKGDNVELFDVVADPIERKNLVADHADVAERLKQTVIAWDKATSR
jgi:arylsulfatase A-like enzyme